MNDQPDFTALMDQVASETKGQAVVVAGYRAQLIAEGMDAGAATYLAVEFQSRFIFGHHFTGLPGTPDQDTE